MIYNAGRGRKAKDAHSLPALAQEALRRKAVKAIVAGRKQKEIANLFGTEQAVCKWMKRVQIFPALFGVTVKSFQGVAGTFDIFDVKGSARGRRPLLRRGLGMIFAIGAEPLWGAKPKG